MVVHSILSSIFRVHHGPRRWVFLPHVILFASGLLLGLAEGVELALLLVYIALVPIFLIQIALPTFAGWIVAFSGWLVFCSMFIEAEYRRFGLGLVNVIGFWLLLALAVLFSAPLYLLRPGAKRVGQGAGKPGTDGT
jgi:hypothetical protein